MEATLAALQRRWADAYASPDDVDPAGWDGFYIPSQNVRVLLNDDRTAYNITKGDTLIGNPISRVMHPENVVIAIEMALAA